MPLLRAATLVVYSGAYLFVLFFAVCLATGLYYLAELVEEYTRLTRKIISYAIKVVLVLHVLLFLIDRLPFLAISVGIASHVVYYRLLKTFPYISLGSYDFLGSVSLLILSHVVWIRFFYTDPRCVYVSMEWIFGFMLAMVWLVPFAFFISLAANESVLPGGGGGGGTYQGFGSSDFDVGSTSSTAAAGAPRRKGRRQSTVLGFLNFLKSKRDEVLPMVTRAIPSSHRDAKSWEGCLRTWDVDGVANVISFDVIVMGRAGLLGRACIHSFGLEIQCKTKPYHQCISKFLLLKFCEENNFSPRPLVSSRSIRQWWSCYREIINGFFGEPHAWASVTWRLKVDSSSSQLLMKSGFVVAIKFCSDLVLQYKLEVYGSF